MNHRQLGASLEDADRPDASRRESAGYPEFAAVMSASRGSANWKETGDSSYTHVYRNTEWLSDSGRLLRVVGGDVHFDGIDRRIDCYDSARVAVYVLRRERDHVVGLGADR